MAQDEAMPLLMELYQWQTRDSNTKIMWSLRPLRIAIRLKSGLRRVVNLPPSQK